MVRFSDMLGGDGEPDDPQAATAARDPAPSDEPAAEHEVAPASAPTEPSAQEVLDRLTQYATATRGAVPPTEPEPEPEPPAPQPEPPEPQPEPPLPEAAVPAPEPAARPPADDASDDILPRGKRSLRSPRGKRGDI